MFTDILNFELAAHSIVLAGYSWLLPCITFRCFLSFFGEIISEVMISDGISVKNGLYQ